MRAGRVGDGWRVLMWVAVVALCPALVPVQTARAQATGQVRGRVVEAGRGDAVAGATVAAVRLGDAGDAARRATTGDEGFFLLLDLPSGRYAITTTAPGFAPAADTVEIGDGQRRVVGIELRALALGEVLVERAAPAGAGARRIDGADLAALPGLTPGGDAGEALAALPSVVTFEDGGALFVRGGEATHVLYRVEGIPVYQPVHSLGPLLAVPTDAVAYVDLLPGALPERLGGRAGAAVEVGLRGGDREHVVARARGGVGPGAGIAGVHIELPVLPGQASLTISGRGQAFGRARVGIPSTGSNDAPSPPGATPIPTGERRFDFADGLVRFHAFASPLATVSALALASRDAVEAPTTDGRRLRLVTENAAAGATLAYLPEQFPIQTEVRAYANRLRTTSERPRARGQTETRTADVDGYGGEIAIAYLLGPQRVTLGLFATSQRFASRGVGMDAAIGQPKTEEFVTEGGAWLGATVDAAGTPLARLGRVEPGVRVHAFPSRARISIEPRLRWTVPAGRGGTVYAAAGVQEQEIGGALLSPGAADAFVAFVPTPEGRPPVRARHAEVGARQRLARGVTADVAVWARRTDHLDTDGRTQARGAGAEATLDARGLALAGRPLALRLSAAAARVRYRAADGAETAPPFDRPLAADALARLALTGGLTLDVGIRAGSGTPVARVAGYADDLDGPPFDVTAPARPVVLSSGTARLPVSARADAALTYRVRRGNASADASIGVRNATGRRNIAYIDALTQTRVDAPGRALTVGLSVGWR